MTFNRLQLAQKANAIASNLAVNAVSLVFTALTNTV